MNMLQNLLLLIVPCLIVLILIFFISKSKKHSQLKAVFKSILFLLFFWFIELILQLLCSERFNIDPLIFECFIYISACFVPVLILFLSLIFVKTKINFTKKYLLFFIIPIISLLVLWTNNFHHLFYIKYSTNFRETVFGNYFYIHSVYSYGCVIFGIIYMLVYSIKNSGIFSKQSLLFVTGTAFCLLTNIISTFGILNLSIYSTPISFTIGILFYAIAIFKFNFLNVTPIALQKIVDRMSDGYLVLDDNNMIIDFNKTFLNTFNVSAEKILNTSISSLPKIVGITYSEKNFNTLLEKAKKTGHTARIEKHFKEIDKYFSIEISTLTSDHSYLGCLVLLKDITQHVLDMNTLKNNQEILMEQERLATLGQMVGGIAHNLKTPIMSISGASEGLKDLINEYDASIEDPEVNFNDHHEIASDMRKWIEKIDSYTAYMSDIITTVKGQAVTLTNQEIVSFTIEELVKRVDILMKHELKHSLINMNVHMNVDSSLTLKGDINSLIQVLNNLISNAIQSYEGAENKDIDLDFNLVNKNLVISVKDYGKGIPKEVQEKLFKEMITTKGKNGTGLGLFMSYSNIRAHFNGNIKFESEVGKGTTFSVILPA